MGTSVAWPQDPDCLSALVEVALVGHWLIVLWLWQAGVVLQVGNLEEGLIHLQPPVVHAHISLRLFIATMPSDREAEDEDAIRFEGSGDPKEDLQDLGVIEVAERPNVDDDVNGSAPLRPGKVLDRGTVAVSRWHPHLGDGDLDVGLGLLNHQELGLSEDCPQQGLVASVAASELEDQAGVLQVLWQVLQC